jgi:prepilin-type N-terminal cleavage/methylation domain-containing protein
MKEKHLSGKLAFTLLEVLLALALFSISVVVLSASFVNVLNSIEAVKVDQTLEQEMAFVRAEVLMAPDLDILEEGGEVLTAGLGFARWEAIAEPTEVADLFEVNVKVTFEGRDEVPERVIEQSLILLRPSWSDPLEREELREITRERLAEDHLRSRPL